MIKYLNYLLEIIERRDKRNILVLLFLLIFSAFLEIIGIGLIPIYVTIVLDPSSLFSLPVIGKMLLQFENIEPRSILINGGILLFFVFLVKAIYMSLLYYFKGKILYGINYSLEKKLFSNYLYKPYKFHLINNTSTLLRNLTTETSVIVTNILFPIINIINNIVLALAIIALLVITNPGITSIVILLLGGSSFLFFKLIKKKTAHYGKIAINQRAEKIRTINHGLGGIKDVTVYNVQRYFSELFNKSALLHAKSAMFRQFVSLINKPFFEIVAISGILIITFGLSFSGKKPEAIAATLALFAASLVRLMPAIRELVTNYSGIKYSYYSIIPIYEHLKEGDNLQAPNKNETKKPNNLSINESISVNNVSFSYNNNEREVLNNISLTVQKNSIIGIVGPTGGGKTTLVDILLGLLKPQKGEILVDGKFSLLDNIVQWRKKVGYVPQYISLIDDSIKNNIALGIAEENINRHKLETAIAAAQLKDFVISLPDGIETIVGERGIRLSGGQRQRIGIARALYNEPEILIFDEATSSLDNQTERNIVSAIDYFRGDKTIIIIAHRVSTVKGCDEILLLKNGTIAAKGTYTELINNEDFKELTLL